MFVQDHEWYFRHLTEHVHMKPSDVMIAQDTAQWCKEYGLPEKDTHKPLKLVPGKGPGARILIAW